MKIHLGDRQTSEADDCLDDLSLSGYIKSTSPETSLTLLIGGASSALVNRDRLSSMQMARRVRRRAADVRQQMRDLGAGMHARTQKRSRFREKGEDKG